MTHDVFYTSDPDTQGRCSVRLPLQALNVSVCVIGGEGATKLRKHKKKKKKAKAQNICSWLCVVTFVSLPRPIRKRVQLEFKH